MLQAARRGDLHSARHPYSSGAYRKTGGDPSYYAGGAGVTVEEAATPSYDDTGDYNEAGAAKTCYSQQQRHNQFYAEEFYTGDEIDDEFQGDASHLTPPCEEDEMIEDDYLVPSIMRGNCYLAQNYTDKMHAGNLQGCSALSTAKKLAVPNSYDDDRIMPEYGHTNNATIPLTPPSSSGSSCLLFIFVEHPQDPSALDKLTLPFEDSLTVMDMMVRVAASKRFVVSDYKAFQFDFDTLCYRLLKPHTTMDQLRHNCIHFFVRNSASAVLDQATGNRDHHVLLSARLPITSANHYFGEDDFTLQDCVIRKFWVPETIAVIELLFFICDRHGLNWREWELWLWIRQRSTAVKPATLPPQMIQLKNLNKLLSYSKVQLSTIITPGSRDNCVTIVVLPKGINSQRVEEMADTLMNDSHKKMKSSKIRRFFSRIFRLKKKQELPKRAISTFEINDTRTQNYSTMPSYFRSHTDLSTTGNPVMQLPLPPKNRAVSQQGTLQEVKDKTRAPLPRINFHKKSRAPSPPNRTSGTKQKSNGKYSIQEVTIPQPIGNTSGSGKKRAAPKPGLVTKVSVPAIDSSDTTLPNASVSAAPPPEISSICDSPNSSVEVKSPVDAGHPPKHPAGIMENPVYAKAGLESQSTEIETKQPQAQEPVVTSVLPGYAAPSSAGDVQPPRHIVSVSVLSEDSSSTAKMDLCSELDDGRQSANSSSTSNDNSVPPASTASSPPSATFAKVDMEASASSTTTTPSPSAGCSVLADERGRSTSPSLASLQPSESPVSSIANKEDPSPRVLSCTEVQINSIEADASGKGVIRIRSGYDISSVAKRTKVIGGGKVKETANRLSESTIVTGLKLMTSSMNAGSTSSVSTVGAGSVSLSEKNDSRNCNTLPLKTCEQNVSPLKKPCENFSNLSGDKIEQNDENSARISSTNRLVDGVTPDSSQVVEPKTSTPFCRIDKNCNNQPVEDTKRATLFTPRPFVPSFTTSPQSSSLPPVPLDSKATTSAKPPLAAKISSNKMTSSSFAVVEEETTAHVIPAPPPLPPDVKKHHISVISIKTATSLPGVNVHPPSSSSSSSSSSGNQIEAIGTSFSPSSSCSSVSASSTTLGSRPLNKPRPVSAKVESPREQILNAIRDGGTVARLKKVPPQEKRYISVVKTYVSGATSVAEPSA